MARVRSVEKDRPAAGGGGRTPNPHVGTSRMLAISFREGFSSFAREGARGIFREFLREPVILIKIVNASFLRVYSNRVGNFTSTRGNGALRTTGERRFFTPEGVFN